MLILNPLYGFYSKQTSQYRGLAVADIKKQTQKPTKVCVRNVSIYPPSTTTLDLHSVSLETEGHDAAPPGDTTPPPGLVPLKYAPRKSINVLFNLVSLTISLSQSTFILTFSLPLILSY